MIKSKSIRWEYIDRCVCGSKSTEKIISSRDFEIECESEFDVVECKNCGLIFTNPRPEMKQLLESFYPENYHCYNRSFENMSLKEKFFSFRTNKYKFDILNKYFSGKKINILDVGCSDGYLLKYLRTKNSDWNLFGLEPNKKVAKGLENYGINIQKSFLKDAQYDTDFFDVIFLLHVLEHVENPLDVLKIINKILKKDGLLIIEVPNVDSLDRKFGGKYWWGYHLPRHLTHFSSKTLNAVCEKAGFQFIKLNKKLRFGCMAWNIENLFSETLFKSIFRKEKVSTNIIGIPFELLNFFLGQSNIILSLFKKI